MKAEQPSPAVSSMPGMPKNVLLDWFVTKTMARDPSNRFQTAREMLEHWWNVMASLDEGGGTDVMRGDGRVDESYAGPLRRSMRDSHDVPAVVTTMEPEEDRTLRRMAPAGGGVPAALRSTATLIVPPSSQEPVSSGAELTLHDQAPNTEPSPGRPHYTDAEDFEMPTRSDPNLRKLVEQELELQRKRRGPPK
jgi:hypothetical protein